MQLASAGQIKLIVSEAIISELKRKLLEKMDWSESQTQLFIGTILELAELVEPDITLNVVPSDEDDNRIVECAIAGNAALIVTFDKDLLRLKAYKMISIITPRQLTFYGLEE
ncbi:MAG: putative toxin-antitoxin system toxin component, PIN family [Chloroflexi bacterium]|nr:putative toxin-antitoxin system toxin component, PIN family [Chloroflexota bacterium]